MAVTFTYKVKDGAGKLHDGEMQASSQSAVAKALRERGFTPVTVEEKKSSVLEREIRIPGLSGRVKVKEVSIFSRQFSTMINSGLSLLRSLTILAEQTPNRAFKEVINTVKADVEKGASLSQALEQHPKIFSRLYTSMVKSGEVGGVLDETLNRLALTLEAQVELRQQVKSAMMYPVAVFGLVIFIVIAMLIFVVPMFESMFADFGADLPLPTKLLMGVSEVFLSYWYIAATVTVALVVGFRRWIATDKGRSRFDAIKLKLPIFGKLVHKTALARFSHTMAALTRTGVPILMSMDIVAETAGNAVVARAVHAVQASVKEGESIAEPLSNHSVFPPMIVQMMAVGEETGALDTMLEKVGDFYDREVKAMVEGLTSLIEPLLVVVLGATVGGMLLALYMPIFNVITLIQ
jgi:type IV pilus assembly protein PilC